MKEKLRHVSGNAGVYRMLDAAGAVIYVGKAKNLKKRLASYTHFDALTARLQKMVAQAADVVVVETSGEAEALLLENDLIKKYRPHYNILLKDDKSYPHILLTHEEIPRLMKYRGNRAAAGSYFGPFASGDAVNKTLRELQKIFGLRTCSPSYFSNRTRPCLLYQIHRCAAPCVGRISGADYRERARQAEDFMRGKTSAIQKNLEREMQEYAQAQAYEKAAAARDKIAALNQIQQADSAALSQADVVAAAIEGKAMCVQIFFFRTGQAGGDVAHCLELADEADAAETLASFLMQFYERFPAPKRLYISHAVAPELAQALAQRAGHRVEVIAGKRLSGARRLLMRQAVQNARRTLEEKTRAQELNAQAWDELRLLMRLPVLETAEVYDNSHIQGVSAVGAMIAATAEGFQKKAYRRFNIPAAQVKTNDDFAMMRHVLLRRLSRGAAEGKLPALLLIDGGKGQLAAVLQVLRELRLPQIAVLAIAKGEKRNAGREVFYSSAAPTKPIHLDPKGDLMHLLQRLRDEAHRFAVGTHRLQRARNMMHESLADIGEIGPQRKKALLHYFGSARAVAGASLEQLQKVSGIHEKIAKKIYTFYHG